MESHGSLIHPTSAEKFGRLTTCIMRLAAITGTMQLVWSLRGRKTDGKFPENGWIGMIHVRFKWSFFSGESVKISGGADFFGCG